MVSVETDFFLGFQVVFLMQKNPSHAVCLDLILQHPSYIKYCLQVTLGENSVFLGIRYCL